MNVHITRLRANATLPRYHTRHSAAMDICAAIDEPLTIGPLQRQLVPAGFAIALPEGFEAQIRARSGLSLRHGITVANGVGTIDADYRGEVGVIALNISNEPYTIEPNERIAQMVVAKYEQVVWQTVETLDQTERHSGGFGSTGK